MRILISLCLGGWKRLPSPLPIILWATYWGGTMMTGTWLVFVDHPGVEGVNRLLLLPADLILAAFWPLYWPGYFLF